MPSPSPFGKDVQEKPADQAKSSVAAVLSGSTGDPDGVTETVGASRDTAAEHRLIGATALDEKGVPLSKPVQKLTRRFSLPTVMLSKSPLPPADTTEAHEHDQVTSCQIEVRHVITIFPFAVADQNIGLEILETLKRMFLYGANAV